MSHIARRTRRVGILLAMALSLALAGGGVWAWIGPETVGAISTARILALLGLLALPFGAAGAMVMEKRARAEAPEHDLAWARPAATAPAEDEGVRARDIRSPRLSAAATGERPAAMASRS